MIISSRYHLNIFSNDIMGNRKRIKQEFKNGEALLQCAEQFGLIGNPTRIKICWLLCKYPELSVGEIAEILGVSISVVSHSLKKLRKHNLVTSRRDYRQVFYSLANTSFNRFLKKSLTSI